MKKVQPPIAKGEISLSKAVAKKLLMLVRQQPSACSATSRATLTDKLVKKLGIDYHQLPKILETAKLVVVDDPSTQKVFLRQAS